MLKKTYIFILFGLLFGAYTLNPLFVVNLPFGRFRTNDLLIVIQSLITFYYFCKKKGRQQLFKKSDISVRMASFYLGAIFLMTLISKAEVTEFGGNELIANLRHVLYFGSYFFTLSLISSEVEERFLIRCMFIHATIASIITIAQSLYGSTPLFGATFSPDSDIYSFYDIGTWAQFDLIGGELTRVNLPTIMLVTWAFLYLVVESKRNFRFRNLPQLGLFSLVIFINYARGLFAGVILALFFAFFYMDWKAGSRTKERIRSTIKVLLTTGIILLTLSFIFGINLFELLVDRLTSATQDLSQSEGTTWQFRMNELEALRSVEFGWREILFGYGFFPRNSLLGFSFIHFGWGDLLYRGGIVFGASLIIFVIIMLRYLYNKIRNDDDLLTKQLSTSLILFFIVLIGFFTSANQFWSSYAYAVMGSISAIIYNRSNRLRRDVPAINLKIQQ